ncbi:unnamed protein product [Vicia faba]|uniref:Uncharacterized protein n=1 Tax=Vicia faba TaxID=3906 RepID=A0AAV0YVP3_VICFA|nr:unnamed protein product [Vicia faba]
MWTLHDSCSTLIFGNIHFLVQNPTTHVSNIQNQIHLMGMNDELKAQEHKAQHDLEDALAKEEIFWMEKARLRWNKHGDRNTSYFHRVTKIKCRKKITRLRNGTMQASDLLDIIPNMVPEPMNSILTYVLSIEEITNVVFGLRKESAPGIIGCQTTTMPILLF